MNSTHNPVERLKSIIALEREDISTIIYYAIGIGFMALATPVAVQALVNTIAFGALFQPLVVLTFVLLVLVGFSNTLAGLQFYVVDMLQRRLFVRLLDASAQRLQQAEYSVSDKLHLPELANRFLDVAILQKTATVMLLETLGYVLQTIIGMILLAFYHPILLAFDLVLIAILVFILFVLGKNGMTTSIEQSKAKFLAVAWLEMLAANPILSKSEQNHSYIKARTEEVASYYLETAAKHFRILARQNTGALILHTLANTALLGLGGWMVIDRQLSLGQLIAAELVVTAMIYGLTRLGKTLDNFYDMLASTDKLSYLLDLPQENNNNGHPSTLSQTNQSTQPYSIDIVNISLPLSPNLDVLRSINLNIQSGECLAFTNGMDKGSLFELIFGLRTPDNGYINLDNQDLRDINLRQLRNSIAIVRDSEIIEASIADNVSLGTKASLTEVKEALLLVQLSNTIAELPDGLNTQLGMNGRPLNSEQRLRLTLARAIVQKPRLLMLDGVLDQIDRRIALDVFLNLSADGKPWTLLLSTHNKDIIVRCDREVRIVNGSIIETGPITDN
jgi:ABC-type bacteriocin/lantibiotic exporter with double-glycine peptidase domain